MPGVTSAMMTANMYKLGDYVYFEVSSNAPYQIRKVEELNKTPSGNVEAKVSCFYRRRDISPSLLELADRHHVSASKDDDNSFNMETNSKVAISKREIGGVKKESSIVDVVPPTIPPVQNIDEDKTIELVENGISCNENEPEIQSDNNITEQQESAMEVDENGKSTEQAVEPETDSKTDSKIDENCMDINEDGSKSQVNSSSNSPKQNGNCSPKLNEVNNIEPVVDSTEIVAKVKTECEPRTETGPTLGLAGIDDLNDDELHQLRHRELFLSRQIETLPATHIRGKCAVTLLNEVETPQNYMGKEDALFYSLVYDPNQKTLLADKGEIRLGDKFQAVVPPILEEEEKESWRKDQILDTLVWRPDHLLTDRQIDQFLIVARAVGTFSRALDGSSSVRQPSLHMSAAAASRDITLLHALSILHHANYELDRAMCYLVPPPNRSQYPLEVDKSTGHRTATLGGPLLCRDQLEEWSAAEANLFEEALEKYGKDFNDIRGDFLPWKSLKDIVEYYYMWKTSDRYVHQRRIKAMEAESRLKQVYIPSYNKVNPAAINPTNQPGQVMHSQKACEGCDQDKSTQFYLWGPPNRHMCLCQDCWTYWKKFGGLKRTHKFEHYDKQVPLPIKSDESMNQLTPVIVPSNNSISDDYRCPECKKVFDRADRLQQHRMTTHPLMRCTVDSCGREFRSRQVLSRHLQVDHQLMFSGDSASAAQMRAGSKSRATFYLHTTVMTRIARRLAPKNLLHSRRNARNPFLPINFIAIKQNCQVDLESKSRQDIEKVKRLILQRSVLNAQKVSTSTANNHTVVTTTPPVASTTNGESKLMGSTVPVEGRTSTRKRNQNGDEGSIPTKRQMFDPNVNQHDPNRDPAQKKRFANWIHTNLDDYIYKSLNPTKTWRKQLKVRQIKRMARSPWKIASQASSMITAQIALNQISPKLS